MELPIINQRIKELVNSKASGSGRKFSYMIFNEYKPVTINRLFKIDKRTGKFPKPSREVVDAIIKRFEIDYSDLTGQVQLLTNDDVENKIKNKFSKLDYNLSQGDVDVLKVKEDSEIYKNTNGNTFKENSDGSYTITVPLVPFEAYASYVETLESEVARIDEWEDVAFNVDKIGKGNYLGFRSKGDSMNGGSLNDTPTNALMLGRELGRQHWMDGFNQTDYGWVIVSKFSMMHKDITGFDRENGIITCHSRNPSPEHQDFTLELNDVYQIFKVIKRTF